jgi:hypothetical protein
LISLFFNHVGGGSVLWRSRDRAARLTFSGWNELLAWRVTTGSDVNQGVLPMGPFVTRLSVVTAYVAFAFVGAIVLGIF